MSIPLKQPEDYGLWRFGIISPLLHRTEDAPIMRIQIEDLAQRMFYTPDGRETCLCPNTIRDWLSRATAHAASTTCATRHAKIAAVRWCLSRSHKRWSSCAKHSRAGRSSACWSICAATAWGRAQTQSQRIVSLRQGAHSLNRTMQQPPLPVRCFEYPYFGDMWTADFMHGPMVRIGSLAEKSYLHAIIDDSTRYIVVARFHLSEDTRSLLDDFALAIRRFGIPKRFYTDNGAAFRSRHLRLVAAKLGVSLPHTPPYTPQGR
jgi:putative transposase